MEMNQREILRTAGEGDEGEVSRLLKADPGLLESEDIGGYRPLTAAAQQGRLRMVRLLVQSGANINARGCFGMTALHWAAYNGYEAVVAFLLSNGAQASIRDLKDRTPLMLACFEGRLGVVKMLLQEMGEQGLEDRNPRGSTPLHYAAKGGHEDVVRFLLLAGANPAIRNNDPRGKEEVVWQWWEGELERRYVLSRAACLQKAFETQRDKPTSQVPTYLKARVAAGHAVPRVEVVLAQSQGEQEQDQGDHEDASGKRKAAGEGGDARGAEAVEEERHAVVGYVLTSLNEELLRELLECFYSPHR